MAEYTCGHCWRTMGDTEGGYGSYDRVPLCHPDEGANRPDCYRNVTIYGHPVLNCEPCKKNEPRPVDQDIDKMLEMGVEKFLSELEFDFEADPDDHHGHNH